MSSEPNAQPSPSPILANLLAYLRLPQQSRCISRRISSNSRGRRRGILPAAFSVMKTSSFGTNEAVKMQEPGVRGISTKISKM